MSTITISFVPNSETLTFNELTNQITDFDNIVLNLFSGLLPEHLNKEEVQILHNKLCNDWFEKLGYNITEYKKPIFNAPIV